MCFIINIALFCQLAIHRICRAKGRAGGTKRCGKRDAALAAPPVVIYSSAVACGPECICLPMPVACVALAYVRAKPDLAKRSFDSVSRSFTLVICCKPSWRQMAAMSCFSASKGLSMPDSVSFGVKERLGAEPHSLPSSAFSAETPLCSHRDVHNERFDLLRVSFCRCSAMMSSCYR